MNKPANDTVAVDVDGTLFRPNGEINRDVLAWIESQKREGKTVIIWSSRGTDYAKMKADEAGILKNVIAVGKPATIIDDKGWSWIHFCRALLPSALSAR